MKCAKYVKSCLVSYFITKPQLRDLHFIEPAGCLVSYFITKPQLLLLDAGVVCVV